VNSGNSAAASGNLEIVVTRVLDAPPALVWRAFTDPKHVPQWWGPSGFRTTTKHMDVTPGGIWRFVMHGPDGRDYENMITYLDVVEPQHLTYRHGGDKDVEPVKFQVTVTFEPIGANGEQTHLTMRSIFPSNRAREFVIREYNAIEGGRQTVERLSEYLRTLAGAGVAGVVATDRPLVATRVYQASRDLLWRMWTAPEHLQRWFGPPGVPIRSRALDLRPGGTFHYAMQPPGGPILWGKWVFREVVPLERLVFVSSFSDADGTITRHPTSADWPLETLSTVTFAEHAGIARGTTLVMHYIPINATATERKAFDNAHAAIQQGWTGALNQLDAYLSELRGKS
jgi:uncharacterized protein YndB with AHSA1/START domain